MICAARMLLKLHHSFTPWQLCIGKWNVALLLAAIMVCCQGTTAKAETPAHGCAKNPSSLIIPSLHAEGEDRVKAIIHLASDYGVCLGIQTDAEKHPVSIRGSNLVLADVIRSFFPNYNVDFQPSIIIIRKAPRARWLDYRMKKFSVSAQTLSFNSLQLFFALQYQLDPNRGGIMGSFPDSINESMVGPLTRYNRTIFQLLNELVVKSSKGGGWIVKDKDVEKGIPPSDRPFWKIVPYGTSAPEIKILLENDNN